MKTAMILAAGRGERLMPLTEQIPKALCLLKNLPIISYHINNLISAGFTKIIINHAYLGWKIRQYINQIKLNQDVEIIYSPEPPGGLETGGGIFNAREIIGENPFITINADIYTDYNLNRLELNKNSLGHLVLVRKRPNHAKGDFGLSNDLRINNINREYIFSGIACYSHELFNNHELGRYSITPTLRLTADNSLLTGEIHNGIWFDIGTVEKLNMVNCVLQE
jgi:MurNAc alpha-1-phosphate uridylyltransferase